MFSIWCLLALEQAFRFFDRNRAGYVRVNKLSLSYSPLSLSLSSCCVGNSTMYAFSGRGYEINPPQLGEIPFSQRRQGRFLLYILSTFMGCFACMLTLKHVAQELVQSALIESNTGRDDRILYKKLIDMNLWSLAARLASGLLSNFSAAFSMNC